MDVSKRARCSELTRKGTPCQAAPVAGESKCAGHLGLGCLDGRKGGLASGQVRAERAEARRRGSLDVAAEKLEANAEALVDAAVRRGKAGDVNATRWLFERVHGRPLERVETLSDAVDVRVLSREQRADL